MSQIVRLEQLVEEAHMRDYAETRLQMATADYLRGIIRNGKNVTQTQKPFPGLLYTHPANETGSATDAFFAMSKGQEKGIFDWLFWWGELENAQSGNQYDGKYDPKWMKVRVGAIEHKVGGRPLSPDQVKWKQKFEAIGGLTAVTSTVGHTRDALIGWGLECKNMLCKEPDISKAEKMRLSTLFQSPQ